MKNQQKGMATVLILIFVGLALGATVLGSNYYVKSMQEQQNTSLAATQAQMRAWQGLSIAESIFGKMSSSEIKKLANAVVSAPQTVALNGINGIALRVTKVNDPTTPTTFDIEITGKAGTNTSLESSSKLAARLVVTPSSPPVTPDRGRAVFNGDLKLSGDITILESDIHNLEILVKGNVEITSNSTQYANIIRSTGNIKIGSGSHFGLLHSNQDIFMEGSTSADAILARGNISLKNSCSNPDDCPIFHAASMGDMLISNSTKVHDLLVGKTLTIRGDAKLGVGYQNAHTFNSTVDGFEITTLAEFDSENGYTGTTTKPKYDKVKNKIDQSGYTYVNTSMISSVADLIVNVPEVKIISDDMFNAYDYKELANYAFTVNSNGYIKVNVKRVMGITDGEYFIGSYDKDIKKYLCSTISGSTSAPVCTSPAVSAAKYIFNQAGISYTSSTKTWLIDQTGMAPGVVWVEGNLEVLRGSYYNTFIATGNFKGGSNTLIYAPNYAAYSGTQTGITYAPMGYCTHTDFELKPAQFCGLANQWDSDVDGGIGNFAAMAGSLMSGTYQGGNITFVNNPEIFGSVWAGNLYGNEGNTQIHGYITSLALGDKAQGNIIKNSTKILLNKLPNSFKPNQGATKPTPPPSGGGTPGVVTRWVRYL